MKMYINAGISLSTGVTFVGEAEKLLIPDNMYQYRIKRRNMTKKKENTARENAEKEITEKQKDGRIEVSCEMEVTLKIIGGKWKLLIIHYLLDEGPKRYNEILRFLKTAHKRTLTTQLRELEEDGIVSRTVYPTVPPQVEYAITEHGKTLQPIVELMCDWGYENAGDKYIMTNAYCTDD